MRPSSLTLPAILLAAAAALAASTGDLEGALDDLGSPFLETRREAVRKLAALGPAGVAKLKGHYPAADYRTKVLVLDALSEEAPRAGIELVCADLGTEDRGVVLAQRRLVSRVYGRVRDYVRSWIVPRLPRGDWRLEEHLRALPGPGKSPRAALARLTRLEEEPLRPLARRLSDLVAEVDQIREAMDRARRTGGPALAERAREMERRLVQHDVERALLAVDEAGAAGHYDGLYAVVGELKRSEGEEGEDAVSALLRILRDEPLPEGGMRRDRGRIYRFLEPLPVHWDEPSDRRKVAALCLGDIAGESVAPALVELFEALDVPEYPSQNERLDLAHACAALGATAPLEEVIEEFEIDLEKPWEAEWRSLTLRWIATAKARLGRFDEAAEYYDRAARVYPGAAMVHYNRACALARGGRVEEALAELRRAFELGYGTAAEDLAWMERDLDLLAVRATDAYQEWAKGLRTAR